MHYKKFSIKNYRCFTEEQTLNFAIPNAGKIGSGITYIVGANNSGKTTLIEGMWMKNGQKIRSSEKLNSGPEFSGYDASNKLIRKFALIRQESNTLVEDPSVSDPLDLFEIITSRRHWESGSGTSDKSSSIIQSTTMGGSPRSPQNIPTASILKDIESNNDRYKKFTTLVQKIIPEFTQWAVGYEDNEFIEYISSSGTRHKTDFLGDGVISVIRILAHLFEGRKSGLIIDEPELSLHPLAQKKLIKLIAEYSQDRQIVISTHSPYFVSWEYLANGAVLNRVAKVSDINSEIFTLQPYSEYSALLKGGNWQQPYLMDVVSKEIFFQENILFVEGQEDVGLLQSYFQDCNLNFFGYGVRGYDNFELALKMANDLGIQKACVLIDSPSEPGSAKNENVVKSLLDTKFGKQYKILQWNKADIRDKESKMFPKKEGYFSGDGTIKPSEELDDFHEKIIEIQKYFS